jgi:hypothetical protein
VIDRLRDLADRPIADDERRRLFALAAAVLALAAVALAALAPAPDHDPAPPARPEPPASVAPAAPPPAPVTRSTPVPQGAERAARRFLKGYLRFLYGHAGAREIERATPQLRRRLSRSRLRVPPAARRRRPRVARLEARLMAAGEVAVRAEVADGGVARYPVAVTVRPGAGGWRVVAVGAD